MPLTFRKVSCCPANDASGRSSAVADERTAKLASGLSAASRANCSRMPASSAGGSGVSTIHWRICGAGGGQRAHVVDVQRGQLVLDALAEAAVAQELAEGVRRGGEAAGHAHAGGGQLADHLAEGGVLAADHLDVGHPQCFERCDQGGRQGGL